MSISYFVDRDKVKRQSSERPLGEEVAEVMSVDRGTIFCVPFVPIEIGLHYLGGGLWACRESADKITFYSEEHR